MSCFCGDEYDDDNNDQVYNDVDLCCCEYINKHGERSHILLTWCDCEAIDEGFDRFVRWQKLNPNNMNQIVSTVTDRLRIPWTGGAKRIPCDVILASLCVPALIILASLSIYFTCFTYIVLTPVILFTVHRKLRGRRKTKNDHLNKNDSDSQVKYKRSQFFCAWLVVSLVTLTIIYYTIVVSTLKITAFENFAWVFMGVTASICLFLTRETSCPGFEIPEQSFDEIIDSGAWRICGDCQRKVPRLASHCRTCNQCYLLRDHHCLWLDTCVSYVNDRWFMLHVIFSFTSLCYGAHLTLTTVCHPKLLEVSFIQVLYPADCTDAYVNFQTSLATSAACYSLLLAVGALFVLIQQTVCIASGIKLREYRIRKRLQVTSNLTTFQAFKNCFRFWWRSTVI